MGSKKDNNSGGKRAEVLSARILKPLVVKETCHAMITKLGIHFFEEKKVVSVYELFISNKLICQNRCLKELALIQKL